jgi:hypothetical protein
MNDHPDFLRSPENLLNPDPRSTSFSFLGENGFEPVTLRWWHKQVAEIDLHDGVPTKIVVNFETAKNLSLFSWHVYRFHTVARTHAYACLELALRIKFFEAIYLAENERRRESYKRRSTHELNVKPYEPINRQEFRPTLRRLLKHAIETGSLKNENFTAWQNRTKARANHRSLLETLEEMSRLGLERMDKDDSKIEITDADRDHDYLAELENTVSFLRNHYAHGTTSLDNRSLSSPRLVAEIINQIYPAAMT